MSWVEPAIALTGAAGGIISGRSAAKSQKEMLRRQAQLINQQANLFKQTTPYYAQLLQQAYGNINGYNGPGSASQLLGYGQQPSGGVGTVTTPQGTFGAYGSRRTLPGAAYTAPATQNYGGLNAEDNLRLKAAEEDINRQAQHNANQLRFNANLSGLNTGAVGAGLARNENEALRNYAQFRRGLAIQAPEMQQQRLAQFANLLNPGLGQGQAAVGGYGQQGAVYGNQANAGYGMAGQAVQNYQYQRNLRKYGNNGTPSADAIRNMVGYTG